MHPNNSMGIFEEGLQRWNQENLNLFFAAFADWIPNGTHPIDRLIDGGKAKTKEVVWDKSLETQQDLDLAYPIGCAIQKRLITRTLH
jgi:tripeptidyl-peptidase-1